MASSSHPFNLPITQNHVTTNSDSDGLSYFDVPAESPTVSWKPISDRGAFADLHISTTNPVSLSTDLAATQKYVSENTTVGFVPPVGAVFQRLDLPPGTSVPMHRSITLGYGIVASGEVDLLLDGGEIRAMKQGDTVVMRAAMHGWKNTSDTEWLRIIWVLFPMEPMEVAGKPLEAEWRG